MSQLTKQEIAFQLELLTDQYHKTILALKTMLDTAIQSPPLNPDFLQTAQRLKTISCDLEKGKEMMAKLE